MPTTNRTRDAATTRVERIQRFDDTLASLMAWAGVAFLVLIAILVVIA